MQIALETEVGDWNVKIQLKEEVKVERRFWLSNLRKLNGFRVRPDPGVTLFEYQGGSDAGGVMTGGSLIEFGKPVVGTVFKCHFDEDDKKESSTFRELIGIKFGLDL